MRILISHKCGSSKNCLRLHIISTIYKNPSGCMTHSNNFSTVMRISREFLRVMRIFEGPRVKIKIVFSNHNLTEIGLNNPKNDHRNQTEKRYQWPLYFSTRFLFDVFDPAYLLSHSCACTHSRSSKLDLTS